MLAALYLQSHMRPVASIHDNVSHQGKSKSIRRALRGLSPQSEVIFQTEDSHSLALTSCYPTLNLSLSSCVSVSLHSTHQR